MAGRRDGGEKRWREGEMAGRRDGGEKRWRGEEMAGRRGGRGGQGVKSLYIMNDP
jgi:hypothetical protein